MLVQGWRQLHHDPYLGGLISRTLQMALESTAIALVLGLPMAAALGLGRGRVSGAGRLAANAGLGLPPVAVGVYGYLLLAGHDTPWGRPWVATMNGIVLGQFILALPVVVALAAAAIRGLPEGLLDQAAALGATGWRLGAFALREARAGVATAAIAAIGSAFAEVGAVTLIGGNSIGSTATLASQVITDASGGRIPSAVEHTLVLLGLMVLLGGALSAVQLWEGGDRRLWRRESLS